MASCLHSDQTALLTQLVQAHDLLSVISHLQAARALVGSSRIVHSEGVIVVQWLPEKPFEGIQLGAGKQGTKEEKGLRAWKLPLI
jgi:hypothetical protein